MSPWCWPCTGGARSWPWTCVRRGLGPTRRGPARPSSRTRRASRRAWPRCWSPPRAFSSLLCACRRPCWRRSSAAVTTRFRGWSSWPSRSACAPLQAPPPRAFVRSTGQAGSALARAGELQGCDLHVYSDNTGAEACLRKGAAKSFDHSCIVHSMWRRAVELDVDLAVFRVPTAENLADLPSRHARGRPRRAAGRSTARRLAGGRTSSCYASARCAYAPGSTKRSGTRTPGAPCLWRACSVRFARHVAPGHVGAGRGAAVSIICTAATRAEHLRACRSNLPRHFAFWERAASASGASLAVSGASGGFMSLFVELCSLHPTAPRAAVAWAADFLAENGFARACELAGADVADFEGWPVTAQANVEVLHEVLRAAQFAARRGGHREGFGARAPRPPYRGLPQEHPRPQARLRASARPPAAARPLRARHPAPRAHPGRHRRASPAPRVGRPRVPRLLRRRPLASLCACQRQSRCQ